MGASESKHWAPSEFRRFEEHYQTSTGPARIVTDAGRAYLKALGNPEGPHALACEWIGAKLARWMELRTFDFAIMEVKPNDEIEMGHGRKAQAGPAFVTRAERGNSWSGDETELRFAENKDHLSGLIVFDTWIRNRDRYVPGRRCHFDNVFLSSQHTSGAARELVAMDHTHCIADSPELTAKIDQTGYVQDETIYGAFPAFRTFWSDEAASNYLSRLGKFDGQTASCIVAGIPREWQVDSSAREATVRFLVNRAKWLSDRSTRVFLTSWEN